MMCFFKSIHIIVLFSNNMICEYCGSTMEIASQFKVEAEGKKPKITTTYRCPKCGHDYRGTVYKEYN